MKQIKYLYIVLVIFIFSSCEDKIYHNFLIENNTKNVVFFQTTLKNDTDTVFTKAVLPDSLTLIYQTLDTQRFFTGKILPKKINDIFNNIKIKDDSILSDKYFINDSLWDISYQPGKYIYKLEINDSIK